ncbi:MAG: hypothetical protein LBF62_01280 [Tannerellaceae bacterium]|jgi:hypothetical protein|nr:hypothetical protein [Tannerellaceae bacterium]
MKAERLFLTSSLFLYPLVFQKPDYQRLITTGDAFACLLRYRDIDIQGIAVCSSSLCCANNHINSIRTLTVTFFTLQTYRKYVKNKV